MNLALLKLFLTSIFIQIAIIAALVVIFLLVTILNLHTKAKRGEDLPEKCISCSSTSCMIKLKDVNKIKEEMKEELNKNCEKENTEEKHER